MKSSMLVVLTLGLLAGGAGAQTPKDTAAARIQREGAAPLVGAAVTAASTASASPADALFNLHEAATAKHEAGKKPAKATVKKTIATTSAPVSTPAPEVKTSDPAIDGCGKDDGCIKNATAPDADFSDVKSGSSHSTSDAAAGAKPSSSYIPNTVELTDTASGTTNATKVAVVEKPHVGVTFTDPISDPAILVKAIRNCDRRIIHVRCDDMLAEANRVTAPKAGRGFATLGEQADFYATLTVGPCPAGEVADFSRGIRDRVLAHDHWRRAFEKGEMCLYLDNVVIASLRCGNPVKDTHYFPGQKASKPKAEKKAEAPSAPSTDANRAGVTQPKDTTSAKKTATPAKGWWTTPKKVTAGGVVLGAASWSYCHWARKSPCGDIFKAPQNRIDNSNTTIIKVGSFSF